MKLHTYFLFDQFDGATRMDNPVKALYFGQGLMVMTCRF